MFLLLLACNSDYILSNTIPKTNDTFLPYISEQIKADVVILLDISGSMNDNTIVHFGMTTIPEQLNDHGYDWQLAITSTSANDSIWIKIFPDDLDPAWSVAEATSLVIEQGNASEEALDASYYKYQFFSSWFRRDSRLIFIIISDEDDQSYIYPEEWNDFFNDPYVVSVVGPIEEITESCTGPTPRYHAITDHYVDICKAERWYIY